MAPDQSGGNKTIEKLRALQARFENDLAQRLDHIDAAWRTLESGEFADDDLQNFHLLLHRLAGSGATFGFPAISQISQQMEDIVLRVINEGAPFDGAARQQIRNSIDALRNAAHAPVPIEWESRSPE